MRLIVPLTLVLLPAILSGTPTRVLVIGDSMSEEYAHELPFSAPDSNPSNANTRNWIESLDALRGTDLDFGSDSAYADLRVLGFEYNWGFPGATAGFWAEVLDSDFLDNPLYYGTKLNILDKINNVHVIVLFVGGNDVSSDYGNLYIDAPTPGEKEAYLANIAFISINAVLGTAIAPLSETEIAADVLELRPYLDWIATIPGADPDLLADQDGDGLPNIGEFALQSHPLHPNTHALLPGTPTTLTFTPDPAASSVVETIAEESADVQTWSPVPPSRLTTHPDGFITASLPAGTRAFVRLSFPLAP